MVKSKKERTRNKYTEETLKAAVAAVKAGGGLSMVSFQYGIPKSTLKDKSADEDPIIKRKGPATILSDEEETQIVDWVLYMSAHGFPITKSILIESVACFIKELKRDNPFTNNRPGRSWYDSFLCRHPELSQIIAQNFSFSRALVTEAALRQWFEEVNAQLNNAIGTDYDATRVFNCDESAFYLTPNGDKVLVKKGDKTAYNFTPNAENECLTVLFSANAAGTVAPPMILFKYERIPAAISASIPDSWEIGKTETGWTTGESFFEYISNVFYPWLVSNNIEFPILLYLDGQASYLTMALTEFCRIHEIILVALYPNSTHLTRPLDVGFFKPTKDAWSRATTEWRMNHNGAHMRKENFAPVLVQALDMLNGSDIIGGAFQACGLYPFNQDAVDYKQLVSRTKSPLVTSIRILKETPVEHPDKLLMTIEKYIDENTLEQFRAAENFKMWSGDLRDESLFRVWNAIRRRDRHLLS